MKDIEPVAEAFAIVFSALEVAIREDREAGTHGGLLEPHELLEIDELRRFALEVNRPEMSFTTST